ncbi:MAG: carboxy terminal-processing peptidase [Opitutales bacterium]
MTKSSSLAWFLAFAVVVGLIAPAQAERFYTTNTMRRETQLVLRYLEHQHFQRRPVDVLDMNLLIEDFVDDLDGQRLFLHQPEVDGFKREFAEELPDLLRQGRLDPAFEIFDVFSQRFEKRLEWIFNRLEEPFDFSSDDTYATDRDEAEWPKNSREADRLWEQRLKYQLLNEILANYNGEPDAPAVEQGGVIQPEEESSSPLPGLDLGEFQPGPTKTQPNSEGSPTEAPERSFQDLADELENPEFPDVIVPGSSPGKPSGSPEAVAAEETSETEPFDFDKALEEAREIVRNRYEFLEESIVNMDGIDVQEVFLTALANRYDPHSTFMSANTVEEFEIAMRNSLVGIGAVLTVEDGYCTIRELIPGGPAEASDGLAPGDRIVGVAQGEDGEMVDVIGMPLDKVVQRIRGEEGTVVRLLIQPAGSDPSSREELELVRDQIQLTSTLASARVFTVPNGDRTVPVGVIELPAFYGADEASGTQNTTEDVAELISHLKDMGVEALVLDLRSNGGGLLSEAVRLTGLFIDEGPVVQVRNTRGRVRQYDDEEKGLAWEGPLAVLVSRYSASASEITAGALKVHNRALVIGDEETHGKGTVQEVFRLSQSPVLSSMVARRGAAKVTVQKFYLPDGSSTQIRGVNSHIKLPSLNGLLPIGESDLENALGWDTIPPAEEQVELGNSITISQELVDLLAEASHQRQETLAEFNYLRDSIERFRERYERDEVSLNLGTREIQRAADRALDDVLESQLKELDHLRYEGEEVLLNLAADRRREGKTEASVDDGHEAEAANEPEPLDIHLRETLRIMADWISHLDGADLAEKAQVVAERKEPHG